MASTLVLLLHLLLVSLASASHYFAGTLMFSYKGRNPDGTFKVDIRNRATFDGCHHAHYWHCYSGDCGNSSITERSVLDGSINAPQYNNRWCETETVRTQNVPSDKPFEMRAASCCWIPTRNSVYYWNLMTSVDLGTRSDTGKPNSSPDVAILPLLRVPQNCPRTYKLMSFDPDGDKVRCRYGNIPHLECSSCNQPSGFSLDQDSCTLQYHYSNADPRVYAFEMVVEEFPQGSITLSYADGSRVSKAPLTLRRRRRWWWNATPSTTQSGWWHGPSWTPTAPTATTAPATTTNPWWWWHHFTTTTTAPTTTTTATTAPTTTTPPWWWWHTTTTTTTAPTTTATTAPTTPPWWWWHTTTTTTTAPTTTATTAPTTPPWWWWHTTTTTTTAPTTTATTAPTTPPWWWWHTTTTTTTAPTTTATTAPTTPPWWWWHTTTTTTTAPTTTATTAPTTPPWWWWHTTTTTTTAPTTTATTAPTTPPWWWWHTTTTTTTAPTTTATTAPTTPPWWWWHTTTTTTTAPTTTATTAPTTPPWWWWHTTTTTTTAPTTTATTAPTTPPWWWWHTTTTTPQAPSTTTPTYTSTTSNPHSTTPLSKLPLQFSFLVDPPAPSCQEGHYLPKFVHPTPENEARIQTAVNQEVDIKVKVEATHATIHDIIISGPLNISKHRTSYDEFAIRWTPVPDDLGDHYPICFAVESATGSAVTSAQFTQHHHHHGTPSPQSGIYQSEMRCVLVDVVKREVKANVICSEFTITVEVEKASIPELHEDHLRLSEPTNTVCSLQSNSTHIFAVVPLNACGTQIEEDDDNLIFKNEITTVNNTDNLITRKHQLEVQFSCQYPKQGNITLGYTAHRRNVIVEEKGFGTFTYGFEFYPNNGFQSMIDPNSYPLEYDVGDRIYMQIEATSSVNNTELFVESCSAAPYDNPNYWPTYPIIENGCELDLTVETHSPANQRQFRFSMEAFKFIGLHYQVYISCSVMMCKVGESGTRCSQGCINATWSDEHHHHHRKREAVTESSKHLVSQGPIRLRRSAEGAGTTGMNLNLNLVFIAGCLLAAVGMVTAAAMYKAKLSRVRYQPLPTFES